MTCVPGYRIYYSVIKGKMILLFIAGGQKKTQNSDVDKAIRYLADYKNRLKP
jgi:putative addiction module killer protein